MGQVIGVAGAPGAGKTSLVLGLAQVLEDACALHMDDYERMTRRPIADVARWMHAGADLDAFEFPGLEPELARLKDAHRYVLFETQFGRAHRATGRHIDCLVWIETPPDLALARNLQAFIAGFLAEPPRHGERLQWLEGYLGNYVDTVRELLGMQRERVGAQADLALDGTRPLQELIERAQGEILRRLP